MTWKEVKQYENDRVNLFRLRQATTEIWGKGPDYIVEQYCDILFPIDMKRVELEKDEEKKEQLKRDLQDEAIRSRRFEVLRAIMTCSPEGIKDLAPDRRNIVLSMQDIIKRYGAVWIENVSTFLLETLLF